MVLAREITKTWETIVGDNVANLRQWLGEDPNRTKGEMVLIIEGKVKQETDEINPQALKALELISQSLPLKRRLPLWRKSMVIRKMRCINMD